MTEGPVVMAFPEQLLSRIADAKDDQDKARSAFTMADHKERETRTAYNAAVHALVLWQMAARKEGRHGSLLDGREHREMPGLKKVGD